VIVPAVLILQQLERGWGANTSRIRLCRGRSERFPKTLCRNIRQQSRSPGIVKFANCKTTPHSH